MRSNIPSVLRVPLLALSATLLCSCLPAKAAPAEQNAATTQARSSALSLVVEVEGPGGVALAKPLTFALSDCLGAFDDAPFEWNKGETLDPASLARFKIGARATSTDFARGLAVIVGDYDLERVVGWRSFSSESGGAQLSIPILGSLRPAAGKFAATLPLGGPRGLIARSIDGVSIYGSITREAL